MNTDSSPSNPDPHRPQYPGDEYPGNRPQQASPYRASPPGYAPPPQQGYGPPPGYAPQWRPTKPFSNKAIVSIIFAGCGLFLFPLGIILNLVGAGLGLSGMKDTHPENGTHRGRGLAVAGLWTNVVMWLLTAAIGVGVTMLIVTAIEKEEQRRTERQADWAEDDLRKIEERLELYYVENRSSLGPGGPVVRDGWDGGLYPDDHPRVAGQLRVNDLVFDHDLMHSTYDYDLKVTGEKSAIITYQKTGRKLVITDIGQRRSRFEG